MLIIFVSAIVAFSCIMIVQHLENKYEPNKPRMLSFPVKTWIFGYVSGMIVQSISFWLALSNTTP